MKSSECESSLTEQSDMRAIASDASSSPFNALKASGKRFATGRCAGRHGHITCIEMVDHNITEYERFERAFAINIGEFTLRIGRGCNVRINKMDVFDHGFLKLTIIDDKSLGIFCFDECRMIKDAAFKNRFRKNCLGKTTLMEGTTCKFGILKIDGIKFDIVKNAIFPCRIRTGNTMHANSCNMVAFEASP
jgi:hypothetical protein